MNQHGKIAWRHAVWQAAQHQRSAGWHNGAIIAAVWRTAWRLAGNVAFLAHQTAISININHLKQQRNAT